MQFDDRLATVLRTQAGSERAAATQFRQLLDLVGTAPQGADEELLEDAYARLGVLTRELPGQTRAQIVREPALRLRNPELVAFLAGQELPVAAAAMSTARLDDEQWEALVPALPVPVRGLLRHRKDLPDRTRGMLARLGVADLVLPDNGRELVGADDEDDGAVLELDAALAISDEAGDGIGAIVRRIEAFQRARKSATAGADSPRLPLGEEPLEAPRSRQAFDFATDTEGRITWADPALAPMTVGILLGSDQPDAPAQAGATLVAAMRRRQPVRNGWVKLTGAPQIEGEWRIDAAPNFSIHGGRFTGYRGRMRRSVDLPEPVPPRPVDSTSDRIRQMLHELRTPVNAIQVAAEIIQQQLYGPTPNEYRALAATIASDAARMLAGFEELDRLARLESGALELDEGTADFRTIVAATAAQLDSVLRPRSAGLELEAPVAPCPIPVTREDAELLAWRILATLAGATSPGEALQLDLESAGGTVRLAVDLPASLADRDNIFESGVPAQAHAVSAGMFGAGFTFRLARAEARAAGGELARLEERLVLTLPAAQSAPAGNGDKDVDYDPKMSDIV